MEATGTRPRILSVIYCLFFSVVCCLLFSTVDSDLASDQAALEAFRSAVGPSLEWNSDVSPCSWKGVACSGGRVTVLRLPAVRLIGAIPTGVFSNLTSLRIISLRFNGLSGGLPSDIGSLIELRNLYLQNNRFSGELPLGISTMVNLVRLNLADNGFQGGIPVGLRNLQRLGTLYLENNGFSGEIPDLDLPNLVQFNVSFNSNLSGSVPESLQSQPPKAFLGISLCGEPLEPCSVSPSPPPTEDVPSGNQSNSKLSAGTIAVIIGGVFGSFVLLALVFLLCCRKRKTVATPRESTTEIEEGMPPSSSVSQPVATITTPSSSSGGHLTNTKKQLLFFREGANRRVFDLEDLLRASAELLGKGTLGTTYKAVLESGTTVAVKRLKDADMVESQFRERISPVGAMDHPCLLPLQAYYYSKDEKLIVYDYSDAGCLSGALHSSRVFLNWDLRCKIAKSAGRGLEYIHSTHPSASHGNVKASNIMMTDSNEGLLSEHGLNTLAGQATQLSRMAGYRAPEVTDARRVSQKSDVYSFGVLLMELVSGKMPTQALVNDEGIDLPRWVQSVVKDDRRSEEVLDMELCRYDFNYKDEMLEMLKLAIECTSPHPDGRPTMPQVVGRILVNHNAHEFNHDDQSID